MEILAKYIDKIRTFEIHLQIEQKHTTYLEIRYDLFIMNKNIDYAQ